MKKSYYLINRLKLVNFFRINIYDIIFDCANDISELNGIYKNLNTYFDIAVNE